MCWISCGVFPWYATKLLVDAGADVVKVEPEGGDPLRGWTLSDADLRGEDGGLFRYLSRPSVEVVGTPSEVVGWAEHADVVVEDLPSGQLDIEEVRKDRPGIVIVSVTPFGRTGPWAERTATEFTMQGWCGINRRAGRAGADSDPGRWPPG